LSAEEYKEMFGLEKRRGIMNEEAREVLRQRVKENYDLVVSQNLLKGGQQSRFRTGSRGRTKEQISWFTWGIGQHLLAGHKIELKLR
jgi:hypothetical protein